MALFSDALYIAAGISFYKFALLGDVYANIVNLAVRIAYCVRFVDAYYSSCREQRLLSWSKALPFLLSIISSGILVHLDDNVIID